METGETGLHGGHALLLVEEELRPDLGHVPIQHQTMEELPVWVHRLTSKAALLRIAQLVNSFSAI